MSINFYTLINSSFNFLKNKLFDIIVLSFIFGFINFLLYNFIFYKDEKIIFDILEKKNQLHSFLNTLKQLSKEDKKVLLQLSFRSFFIFFIEIIILISSILTYLLEINKKNNVNVIQIIFTSFKLFPRIFLLSMICNLLVYIGFIFFIFPGFILMIGCSLSPVILVNTKNITLLDSIKKSFILVFLYFWLIFPILFIWLILEVFISFFMNYFYFLSEYLVSIFSFTINNFLIFCVLIYFFRFYMLIKNKILSREIINF